MKLKIEIEFTGLRPAEKLYEELLIGSDVTGTRHPRIMRANEEYIPLDTLNGLIGEIAAAAENRDRHQVRDVLLRAVGEYAPTNGIEDVIFAARQESADESPPNKVIDLTSRRA